MAMLPRHEIDTLIMLIDDAVEFAAEGKLADGYTVLLAGLHRAKEAKETGEVWAEELMQRYRYALEEYAISYGVRLE
jgi:hypothetical protein